MTDTDTSRTYKDHVRNLWAQGDYSMLAERVHPIAEHLCRATRVDRGRTVLDIATGTGNVAIAAARLGADVRAVDLTPQMVTLTEQRAAATGLPVRVSLADAEDLPFQAATFDIVLSACGLWWAPRPEVAVAEAHRVLRDGGMIGLAGFTPSSYFGQVEELIKRRVPLPNGVPERNDWAEPAHAANRLSDSFQSVRTESGTIPWIFDSPTSATRFLFDNSASHIAARRSLDPSEAAELIKDVEQLTEEFSTVRTRISIELDYLVVLGTVAR